MYQSPGLPAARQQTLLKRKGSVIRQNSNQFAIESAAAAKAASQEKHTQKKRVKHAVVNTRLKDRDEFRKFLFENLSSKARENIAPIFVNKKKKKTTDILTGGTQDESAKGKEKTNKDVIEID